MSDLSEKVVISAALAGGGTMKNMNENVPYTPEEFAEEAYKSYNSGASVVHIHARDVDQGGAPTADIEKIRATIDAIRAKCPKLLINMSSAITIGITPEQRIAPIVEIKPEIGSLNSNSMNFAMADRKTGQVFFEFIFENTFEIIQNFAKKMKENRVKPEVEIYDMGGMYNIKMLMLQQGLFEEPMHFQFVFGVAGGMPFDIGHLKTLKDLLPKGASWSVCGVGPNQFPAAMCAAAVGGHIRVGLEDNIRNIDGSLSKGNYEQVEWAANVCKVAGREVASPEEARKIFNTRLD